MSAEALIGGFAADLALGDPARRHPVAGFGWLASRLEAALYRPSRLRGTIFTLGLVSLAALFAEGLTRAMHRWSHGRSIALGALLWAALGGRSLRVEAHRLADALGAGDLQAARAALPALVGRDVAQLDEPEICRAVVESVAENTVDAVVGAVIWAALAGPPGVAAYRAANTLDAMVGHRCERYEAFGWAAARLDDLINWPAARAGGLLAAGAAPLVGGSPLTALRTMRRDGARHPSPNAGRIEAAFAGALGVRLGGTLSYGSRVERRPTLGDGPAPDIADVRRAARLSLAVGAGATAACAAAQLTRRERR